jgi:hypothetical protein
MSSKTRQPLPLPFLTGPLLIVALALTLGADFGRNAPPLTGEQIYGRQCASCHGAKGEGGKGYAAPLTGKLSVQELTTFIIGNMPPGPRSCPAPEARKVAAYIFDSFYSPLAQDRNRPARVTLSRLTVRQFRNAIADLIGPYHPVLPTDPRHGLHGEYFKGRDFDNNQRVFERIDPEVKFDFGTNGPTPDQFDPHHFSVAWSGSLLAPDTGEYEFVVRTEHAVRLYINGGPPLIDGWVKSGNDNEYHATITLLGGRAYPLRLEFSKSTIGVDDSEQKKGKPAPKASMELLWKRPRLAMETVPQRCLFPTGVPETFVITTPLPPDDRSMGYERGNSVSKAWEEATVGAALETVHYIMPHLSAVSGVPDNAPDRKERLQAFCRQFVERAFRRPLTPDIEQRYITRPFQITPDVDAAVKRVVLFTLTSPHFLYREIDAPERDPYNVAARLSFGLWDTLPDPDLLKAAAAGALTTREQVTQQAQRLAADPRAWNKLREFLLIWLKVDQVPDVVKNRTKFPDFDATVASDLRTSLELFLENNAWGEQADYRNLMTTSDQYLNGRLASLYGVPLPADAPFQKVTLDPSERSGLLTHPYLLSRFAYLDTSSPIHRGVLIARNLLGRTLRPPPAAFAPLSPDLHPNMTTRQRVAMQTRPAPCNTCHDMINPLGFTLERFDAIGRLRQLENGQPIDATGIYLARNGKKVTFTGAKDLGLYLANSPEAQGAFIEKLFQHLVKQPVLAYGPETLPELKRSFTNNRYNIRKLMVDIMAVSVLPSAEKSQTPFRVAGIQ